MAADDLFKRYLEVGAAMLGMSRDRAEGIVRDLVASGEVAKGQASKAADWLVERGRAGTEELKELVRGEVRQQVAALGLATRDDIARLEARLDATAPGATGLAATPRASAGPPGSAAPTRQPEKASTASAAKKAKPAPADEATGTARGAGITRSGSVKRRAGAGASAGSGPPGAVPPAGEAVPPKD